MSVVRHTRGDRNEVATALVFRLDPAAAIVTGIVAIQRIVNQPFPRRISRARLEPGFLSAWDGQPKSVAQLLVAPAANNLFDSGDGEAPGVAGCWMRRHRDLVRVGCDVDENGS